MALLAHITHTTPTWGDITQKYTIIMTIIIGVNGSQWGKYSWRMGHKANFKQEELVDPDN